MNRHLRMIAPALGALALAGCFTVHHSVYPDVQVSSAPAGSEIGVTVSGFEATVTTYSAIYGYESGWRYAPGFYRHGRYHGGYMTPTTYSTTTFVPQTSQTTAYVERAQDALEKAGFRVSATDARYRVEVKFSGPVVTDGDRTAQVLWWLCSALSADYGVQTWTARLKVYDAATNRLLMTNDYTEKYSAVVWGPIPIFSPAGSDQTNYNTMQSWSLSALTDRAMADATAFIASAATAK